MESLTPGGRKSLSVVYEPMGTWLREDCYRVSCMSFSRLNVVFNSDSRWLQLDLGSDHWSKAIEAPSCKLTLLLLASWHIILSRRDDSTMPMTQWPQQSLPFQPCSVGRERRRRRNLRRMRHAVIPIVSFHSSVNGLIHMHRIFIETMLLALKGCGVVPLKCEPRHSEQLRPCAPSVEPIWPTC